ncbi:DUF2141 domain-containing protein [Hymenobacter fastidiosus]|uniref:DUF2141 domain-containing protein n=1 Tax=Hymenobacter fastidiosus TaxID=486264 RepID=A0ABP7SB40_9BACT
MTVFSPAARKFLPFAALLLALPGGASWPQARASGPRHVPGRGPSGNLTGQLTNLRGGRGACYLALFAGAEGFPRQTSQAVRTLRLPVSGAMASFRFENLPPGSYALAVYHDENSNGQLDKNSLGLPTERYGFSNNARSMMFFPPSFGAARFAVAEAGTAIGVKLR